jgi:hypothetical protein
VTRKTHPVGNLDAAEEQFSSTAKSMNVEPVSYAKFSRHGSESSLDSTSVCLLAIANKKIASTVFP